MNIHYIPFINATTSRQLPPEVVSLLQTVSLALMAPLSLVLLVILIIQRQETFFNRLYGNLIMCSFLCSVIARPATILSTIGSYKFDPSYCTAYVFMLELETVGVPLAVLALIVERTLYFSCLPKNTSLDSYKQKLAWKVVLVALPWTAGILFACVKTFGLLQPIVPLRDVSRGLDDTDRYYYSCHLEGRSQEAHNAGEALLYSVRSGIPLVYLCVAIVVMLVYWCKVESPENEDETENIQNGSSIAEVDHRMVGNLAITPTPAVPIENGDKCRTNSHEEETTEKHEATCQPKEPTTHVKNRQIGCMKCRTHSQESTETNDSTATSQDLLEPKDKMNATVSIVILLALTCACVSVGGSVMVKYYGWLYETAQWLYFSMEVIAVILAYCFIPEVGQTLCCRKCRDEDRKKEKDMSNHSISEYNMTSV